MRIKGKKDALLLSELAQTLQHILRAASATQIDIERATGIDQTTVSRAKSGKLKRISEKVLRLKSYADMSVKNLNISGEVLRAAKGFYAAGGTEQELVKSIQHVTSLVVPRLAGRLDKKE